MHLFQKHCSFVQKWSATATGVFCFLLLVSGCHTNRLFTGPISTSEGDSVAIRTAIVGVLARENETFCNRDYVGWAATWVHAPFALKTYTGPGLYSEYSGWVAIDSLARDYFRQHPQPDAQPVGQQQWQVRVMGDAAWVTFEQTDDRHGRKKELRLLERQRDGWKIAVMGTVYQEKR